MERSKILHVILAVLTGLVIFCAFRFPVSATEDIETYTYTISESGKRANSSGNYFLYSASRSYVSQYPVVGVASDDRSSAHLFYYKSSVLKDAYFTMDSYSCIENTGVSNAESFYTVGNTSCGTELTHTWTQSDVDCYVNVSLSFPVFNSVDSALNYLQTGDDSGQINKPSIETSDKMPIDCDLNDYANYLSGYKLTGFMADYAVNASWTGVEYPDTLNTSIVADERVYVRLAYAYKSQPTQIACEKWAPFYYQTDNLEGFIDVSLCQPSDNSLYLRSVQFIPCLYTSIYSKALDRYLEHWMYGSINTVYFSADPDGNVSSDKITTDNGNINGNDYSSTNLPGNKYGDYSSIDTALNSFVDLLDTLQGSIDRVGKFATSVFSWLPWWAYMLLGGSIVVVILLRFIGR